MQRLGTDLPLNKMSGGKRSRQGNEERERCLVEMLGEVSRFRSRRGG